MRPESEREMAEGRARGVIGCLTAGFEMLPQNLQAAALPVALDLVLWLGPRLSIGSLLQGVLDVLMTNPTMADPEMAEQMEQVMVLIEEFGRRFNLLATIGSVPLLHVPSLLARHMPAAGTPLGAARVVSLRSVLAVVAWWALLMLAGIALGFLYLNEIAQRVAGGQRLQNPTAYQDGGSHRRLVYSDGRKSGRRLLQFLLFGLGLLAGVFVVVPLWMTTVTVGTIIAPLVGMLLWVGGVGFLTYAGLHLVLVVPSLLVGRRSLGQALGESIVLSHRGLGSLLGFVLLSVVIYEGLGYAWTLPRSDSWAMVIGIVGNSLVATGLSGAVFEFYRDRVSLIRGVVGTIGE